MSQKQGDAAQLKKKGEKKKAKSTQKLKLKIKTTKIIEKGKKLQQLECMLLGL